MKKILLLLLAFLSITTATAQMVKPVKWNSKVEKISETEVNLIMEATIEKDWHVYSQFTPDGGPLPAEFDFKDAKGNYELIGKVKESPYKKQYNDIFEVDEYYFANKATFTQKVKITNPKLTTIKATIDFQVCKEVCINDNNAFTFTLPKLNPAAKEETVATPTETVVEDTAKATEVTVDTTTVAKATPATTPTETPKPEEKKGLWTIFFLAFLGGFAALLTPCVFPMIPMTVSFFTKQSKNPAQGKRNAILYGVSIIAIYLILGSLVTGIFGAEALNELSTDVWFNIIFFLLLVVFAASFLGAFEIMLPNSWANKVDRQADKGGIVGIFFMALALAIVSFSCTGPIVGTLLVESASKGGIAPTIGMLGFSSALALPFMLFAMFPSWLSSLPKSGGWLNTVKVSLGFLELALAFKFLSQADLVLQLHLLEREVFLAIWIAIFGTWALYLFGKITTPHDSPMTHISVGRLSFGVLVLAFTIYMIPGLFGAPLKLISAFPPPQTYSESPRGFFGGSSANTEVELPEGAELGEHDIITFHDYADGFAYAKKVNKPIMLDFTGYACVNCRKMEINVWSDEKVLQVLKNDVVLISLYVDDKRLLPADEQYVSKETGKEVKTIGNKWTDFIITRYKTNTQPYYVLTDLNEKSLNTPISYTPNIDEYLAWLKDGIGKFK
ncbi:protein-disulfide reductase DsbD family protein [Flavobacterium capsici]|uniref:Cytochrome c biogenesis protein CcdA n=1 Tax=Flavobacterium capsici TaxID=3075618 RepID=A0AA96F4F4_9FLAO|nr:MULTISPECIES: cytochrome c biogenesis protein CcdA [unclassified Flavobacterium]WNM18444.1 cytochrome c biogenesis protein CcdA [Flavobacterium sp. PMR2A8]WNM22495.1 cytochrome c biogenesis protein CcdA [Flavobacterium sp. PMTSA4]